MLIVERSRIEEALAELDLVPLIEEAFRGYSAGRAIVPPVGELLLEKGEVHIKYGAIGGDDYYVIKIASGFYGNAALGLPSSNGLMLVFRQDTGEPEAVLLDEGHLTDVRTAAAGAVGARALAPPEVERIGVLGAGVAGAAAGAAPGAAVRDARGRWPGVATRCAWSATAPTWPRPGSTWSRWQRPAGGGRGGRAHRDHDALDRAAAAGRRHPAGHAHQRHRLRHGREAGAGRRRAGAGRRGRGRQPASSAAPGARSPGPWPPAPSTSTRWSSWARCWRARPRAARRREQITVFDSTGVAVQDIAIATAVVEAVAE